MAPNVPRVGDAALARCAEGRAPQRSEERKRLHAVRRRNNLTS